MKGEISNQLNLKEHMNRAATKTYTWRKDGRWDDLIVVGIFNGIKYLSDFGVAEVVTRGENIGKYSC